MNNSYFSLCIIGKNGPVSEGFMNKKIYSFSGACEYVALLPYRRNENKEDILSVLKDGYGTCSTKHALLKRLADENNISGLELMLGIFKMDGNNTPALDDVVKNYQLSYIPEAHNFLRYKNEILDFTNIKSGSTKWSDFILEEFAIEPEQITDFKVNYHKNFLTKWLQENDDIKYSLDELFSIREKCIAALQKN